MEHKTYHSFDTKIADADQGIVETVFAVSGVLDEGDDIIHPGAFTRTITEAGHKVKLLDQHRTDSVMAALGRVRALRELDQMDLPQSMRERFPEAKGGAWAQVQFLLNTPEGAGAFERIKQGVISEWSFGYDAIKADYSPESRKDGSTVNARNLREIKLYELSPVLWGMNPATATLSAKAATPSEGKPWRAVHEDDGKWRVYKLDADGKSTGKPLGEHDSEDEAQAQLGALYASERDKAAETLTATKVGRVLAKRNAERLSRALAELNDVLKDAGLLEIAEDDEAPAPEDGKDEKHNSPAETLTPKGLDSPAETLAFKVAVADLLKQQMELTTLEVR